MLRYQLIMIGWKKHYVMILICLVGLLIFLMNRMIHSLITWNVSLVPRKKLVILYTVQSNTTTVVTTQESIDNMHVNESSNLPRIDDDD